MTTYWWLWMHGIWKEFEYLKFARYKTCISYLWGSMVINSQDYKLKKKIEKSLCLINLMYIIIRAFKHVIKKSTSYVYLDEMYTFDYIFLKSSWKHEWIKLLKLTYHACDWSSMVINFQDRKLKKKILNPLCWILNGLNLAHFMHIK